MSLLGQTSLEKRGLKSIRIEKIRILNPRARNQRNFAEIVNSIAQVARPNARSAGTPSPPLLFEWTVAPARQSAVDRIPKRLHRQNCRRLHQPSHGRHPNRCGANAGAGGMPPGGGGMGGMGGMDF